MAATIAVAAVVTAPPAAAQDPVRRDTTADTSAARRDSLARIEAERRRLAQQVARAADSIKAPIARAEVPPSVTIGDRYVFNRADLTGISALTLGELLDRIPGVTSYRAGWIAAPEMAALNGRFGRVRIFLDGVELDPLNSRLNGQHDLSLVDMWQLEDATVETVADEIRVHFRSWRVNNTTPVTRIDVQTGDLQTNFYRGFFGKRFPGGQAIQLAGNHYATTDKRTGELGDQTSLWGRIGMARGTWSADATVLRSGRKFTERTFEGDPDIDTDTLPTMDGIWTVGIARFALGDPVNSPWWIQGLASAQTYDIRNPPLIEIDSIPGPGGGGPGGSLEEPDTLTIPNDTTQSRPQFVLTGGLTRGPFRVSAAGRLRRSQGDMLFSPAVRVGFLSGPLTLSFLGERSRPEKVQRIEGSGRFMIGERFAVSGSVSQFSPIENADAPTSLAMRAEGGARVGRMWVTAGAIRRDTAFLPAAIALDTAFGSAAQGPSNGLFATIHGKFYRDVGVDISAVRFDDADVYRPQYETRSRIYLDSDMRNKFPSGNLNIQLSITHEYRTEVLFPTATGALESSQYRTWGGELEIRLLTATITLMYRNFLGAEYQQVPGFTMPSVTSMYGVRWTFIN